MLEKKNGQSVSEKKEQPVVTKEKKKIEDRPMASEQIHVDGNHRSLAIF